MKQIVSLETGWQLSAPEKGKWLDIPFMPMGVHEILHEKKIIDDDFLIGEGEKIKWVAERDWIYRCTFNVPRHTGPAYLSFGMLDTVVRICLNGREIGRWEDIYLPLRLNVSGQLKEENLLELHFQSPYKYIKDHPLPPEWKGKISPQRVLRKPDCDFSNYLGAQPYITLIGVFGDIRLELIDQSEILEAETEPLLSGGGNLGAVAVRLKVPEPKGLRAEAAIYDGKRKKIDSVELRFRGGEAEGSLLVREPELWWPRGYGSQALYTVEIKLLREETGELLDKEERAIGFREIKTDLNFNLQVNNKKIRLWGSNMVPPDGKTRRWNGGRVKTVLDLFEMANMNTIRVWGQGEPLADEFYRECDRRGILVWQEFYHGYGMMPDWKEYQDLCVREAEFQVSRLKHHPCIFMWCGGNEVVMGRDFDHPGEKVIGLDLITKKYPQVCARLDRSRFYMPSSPHGGAYANDAKEGDTHGYEMWWYIPGMEYPVACTELMRVSGPAVKSMRRWIPEGKLWDEGFVDSTYPWKRQGDLMPRSWFHRVANSLDIKAGPVHEFRDAETPYELAYKYAAAHAKAFKLEIKRSRMGRPSYSGKMRISNAHLIWKLFDTWPLIYSAIIDYYLEPFIPYYEAKRSYEPVMCCFDIRDSITLWLVNDSATDSSGSVEYGLFTPRTNKVLVSRKINAKMASGESGEIANLDDFGQFRTENILFARYTDKKRGIDYLAIDYVDIERRLIFPEAKLTLTLEGNSLSVSSDSFARCVELEGNDGGDEFGFYFEDNYFDLLPGITRKVGIKGLHKSGLISAKAHYSPHKAEIKWQGGSVVPHSKK